MIPQPPMPFEGGVITIIDEIWFHFVDHLVMGVIGVITTSACVI